MPNNSIALTWLNWINDTPQQESSYERQVRLDSEREALRDYQTQINAITQAQTQFERERAERAERWGLRASNYGVSHAMGYEDQVSGMRFYTNNGQPSTQAQQNAIGNVFQYQQQDRMWFHNYYDAGMTFKKISKSRIPSWF